MIVYMPEPPILPPGPSILPFIQWRIDELEKPKRMEMNMFDRSLEFIADFTNAIMTFKILDFEIMPFILYILIVVFVTLFYIDLVYLYIAGILLMAFCIVRFKSYGMIIGILLFSVGATVAVRGRILVMDMNANIKRETESALESL